MRFDVLKEDIARYLASHPDATRDDIKRAFICYASQFDMVDAALNDMVKRGVFRDNK